LGVIGMLGLVAAAGPALYIFGQLATASGTLAAAFTAKGLATRLLTTDLVLATAGLRGYVVQAMASVTANGALGAATIGLGTAMKGLWAIIAANPIGAVVAIVGAAIVAFAKWREGAANQAATQQTDAIKADTIARAKQLGVILKATDANQKYTEAVELLNYRENVRLGLVPKNVDLERQLLAGRVRLGEITQEQANIETASIGIAQQATTVHQNRISFANAAAIAQKAVNEELKATGYTLAEATAYLKQNEVGFKAWADQVKLSPATLKAIEANSGFIGDLKAMTTKPTAEAGTLSAPTSWLPTARLARAWVAVVTGAPFDQ
jgi:hypothetical protein